MKKKLLVLLITVIAVMTGCDSEADVVSENISQSSDSFEIQRRIVFFNGITDKYLLTVEGLCALGNNDSNLRMTVTCKVGKDEYKKHYLGLSDNVSFFAEQLEPNKEDPFHYKILFRPENIIPDIELQTSKTKK